MLTTKVDQTLTQPRCCAEKNKINLIPCNFKKKKTKFYLCIYFVDKWKKIK